MLATQSSRKHTLGARMYEAILRLFPGCQPPPGPLLRYPNSAILALVPKRVHAAPNKTSDSGVGDSSSSYSCRIMSAQYHWEPHKH